jgi:hypothetical protein
VKQAVKDMTREFERQQATRQSDSADDELRRSVIEELTQPLRRRMNEDDWADTLESIEGRFAQLPRGLRRSKYVAECRQAMSPWSLPLEQADEQERRRRIRESAKIGLFLKLPYGFPDELRKEAVAAMSQTIDQTDTADDSVIDAAIQEAVMPYLDRHQAKKKAEQAKAKLAEEAAQQARQRTAVAESFVARLLADCVESCLREMRRQAYPDDLMTQWKVKDAIRPGLIESLATITNLDQLGDKFVKSRIERVARDYVVRHIPKRVA